MIINNASSTTGTVRSIQLHFHFSSFEHADLMLEPGIEYATILSWISSRVPSTSRIDDVVEAATRIDLTLGHVDLDRITQDLDLIDDLYRNLGIVAEVEYALANTGHGVVDAELQGKLVLLLKTRREEVA